MPGSYIGSFLGRPKSKEVRLSNRKIKRGEIYLAWSPPVIGSEQAGERPVLAISNNRGNQYGPIVIVATITSQTAKRKKLPTQVALSTDEGLATDSLILCEQLRTMDKRRLIKYLTTLNDEKMKEVDEALLVSLGLRKV